MSSSTINCNLHRLLSTLTRVSDFVVSWFHALGKKLDPATPE